MAGQRPIILWLRQDLRVSDHRALTAAVATGEPVLPVFVLDEAAAGAWAPGAASRWWLHKSLESLAADLSGMGATLILRRGATAEILARLADETGAGGVYCSRGYEPWAARLEASVRAALVERGCEVRRFAGVLLKEPEDLRTQAGEPYKVYTPFWRALAASEPPGRPLPAPKALLMPKTRVASDRLADWGLLPKKPDWARGLRETWQPGEAGARARLDSFVEASLAAYAENRNRPDVEGTSRLSPHLHFGEISPRQCWHGAMSGAGGKGRLDKGLETYLKEIVWREFAYHLLHHWPDLPEVPFRKEFQHFPWSRDGKKLAAWQRGLTGYPIVDAGMRELWHTGWMHNRVRMIVASFLIKDLLLPWQDGEAWFWDTLVDADLASNAASWQWVAGSGADAAPYFRIFNPVTQGEKFDPEGNYVRRWVPELARLPAAAIHAPWDAPAQILSEAGVKLGRTYPLPIVDHAEAREKALRGYEKVKAAAQR